MHSATSALDGVRVDIGQLTRDGAISYEQAIRLQREARGMSQRAVIDVAGRHYGIKIALGTLVKLENAGLQKDPSPDLLAGVLLALRLELADIGLDKDADPWRPVEAMLRGYRLPGTAGTAGTATVAAPVADGDVRPPAPKTVEAKTVQGSLEEPQGSPLAEVDQAALMCAASSATAGGRAGRHGRARSSAA